jgi:hypothetical protein
MILLFIGIIMEFPFSGCINWAYVVEHNQLRTIKENDFEMRKEQ